jgi:hypothetical protein
VHTCLRVLKHRDGERESERKRKRLRVKEKKRGRERYIEKKGGKRDGLRKILEKKAKSGHFAVTHMKNARHMVEFLMKKNQLKIIY